MRTTTLSPALHFRSTHPHPMTTPAPAIDRGRALAGNDHRCSTNRHRHNGSEQGAALGRTLWWTVTGNGGTLTISSKGSTPTQSWPPITGQTSSWVAMTTAQNFDSEMRINTTAGSSLPVQLGGFCLGFDGAGDCNNAEFGGVRIAAWTQPFNDARQNAEPIAHGGLVRGGRRAQPRPARTLPVARVPLARRFGSASTHRPRAGLPSAPRAFDTVIAVYEGECDFAARLSRRCRRSRRIQMTVDVDPGRVAITCRSVASAQESRAEAGHVTYGVIFEDDRDGMMTSVSTPTASAGGARTATTPTSSSGPACRRS